MLDQDREQAYRDMIELIRKIADYIFADRKKVKERLGDIMGGKVLELETDKLIKIGEEKGRQDMALKKLSKGIYSINEISDVTGLSEGILQDLRKNLPVKH